MRLLFVSEFPPNASGGGPAVVRQMLKDWPAAQLFWWSCLPDPDARFGQRVAVHRQAAIPARLYPRVKWRRLRSALLENVWAPHAARRLQMSIDELKPDVVWIVPHNWSIPPIHTVLARRRTPYHVSMHDYVDVHDNPARFGVERCARFAAMADRVYANAFTADAISQEMAEDLQRRTGKPADAIVRFGVEPDGLERIGTVESQTRSEIWIAYAGSILVEKEFALFVEALKQIKEVGGRRIRMHFFGANPVAQFSWFDPGWMIVRGNLPETELQHELRRCHWGFSPMALTNVDPRYNRFSFPTKFIAYLAAGLPVITLGHPESSVMRMAARYRVGLNTSATTPEKIAAEVQTALANPAPWNRYGREIIRCASEEFDAQRMRRKLYECFAECARARKES